MNQTSVVEGMLNGVGMLPCVVSVCECVKEREASNIKGDFSAPVSVSSSEAGGRSHHYISLPSPPTLPTSLTTDAHTRVHANISCSTVRILSAQSR